MKNKYTKSIMRDKNKCTKSIMKDEEINTQNQ